MPTLKPGNLSIIELRVRAKELGMKGFSQLNKCDLKKAIIDFGGSIERKKEIIGRVPNTKITLVKKPQSKKKEEEKKEEPKEEPKEKPKKKKYILVHKKAEPKRSESPTRIDREKMKELKLFDRRNKGKKKSRTKTPVGSSYTPFFDDSPIYIPF